MEKLVTGQIVSGSKAMRQCLSIGLVIVVWEEVEKTMNLRAGVSGSWLSVAKDKEKVVVAQVIMKMDKRPGKHFSLQQRIGEEQQSDSYTNYTD